MYPGSYKIIGDCDYDPSASGLQRILPYTFKFPQIEVTLFLEKPLTPSIFKNPQESPESKLLENDEIKILENQKFFLFFDDFDPASAAAMVAVPRIWKFSFKGYLTFTVEADTKFKYPIYRKYYHIQEPILKASRLFKGNLHI